jgi:hypothetical protein
MIDRRGFIGLMLGAAVAPKGVIQGLVTPAPVKEAISISNWICNEADIDKIIQGMKEGDLVAFTVELVVDGLDEGGFKLRTGPLQIKADRV